MYDPQSKDEGGNIKINKENGLNVSPFMFKYYKQPHTPRPLVGFIIITKGSRSNV
jgi:hypothetical protein